MSGALELDLRLNTESGGSMSETWRANVRAEPTATFKDNNHDGRGMREGMISNYIRRRSSTKKAADSKTSTFLTKLYSVLADPTYHELLHWDDAGRQIIVADPGGLEATVLPMIYNQTRFASFSRQLNVTDKTLERIAAGPEATVWSHHVLNRSTPTEDLIAYKRRVQPRIYTRKISDINVSGEASPAEMTVELAEALAQSPALLDQYCGSGQVRFVHEPKVSEGTPHHNRRISVSGRSLHHPYRPAGSQSAGPLASFAFGHNIAPYFHGKSSDGDTEPITSLPGTDAWRTDGRANWEGYVAEAGQLGPLQFNSALLPMSTSAPATQPHFSIQVAHEDPHTSVLWAQTELLRRLSNQPRSSSSSTEGQQMSSAVAFGIGDSWEQIGVQAGPPSPSMLRWTQGSSAHSQGHDLYPQLNLPHGQTQGESPMKGVLAEGRWGQIATAQRHSNGTGGKDFEPDMIFRAAQPIGVHLDHNLAQSRGSRSGTVRHLNSQDPAHELSMPSLTNTQLSSGHIALPHDRLTWPYTPDSASRPEGMTLSGYIGQRSFTSINGLFRLSQSDGRKQSAFKDAWLPSLSSTPAKILSELYDPAHDAALSFGKADPRMIAQQTPKWGLATATQGDFCGGGGTEQRVSATQMAAAVPSIDMEEQENGGDPFAGTDETLVQDPADIQDIFGGYTWPRTSSPDRPASSADQDGRSTGNMPFRVPGETVPEAYRGTAGAERNDTAAGSARGLSEMEAYVRMSEYGSELRH